MKSLSILILLGTVFALILGGLFVVSPATAEASPENVSNQALVEAPAAAEANLASEAQAEVAVDVDAPVAPATGQAIQLETAQTVSEDAGAVLNSTFGVGFEKDTASAPVEQVAVEQAVSNSQPQPAIAGPQDSGVDTVAQTSMDLTSFAASLENGNGSEIVGIYVDGLLAAQVGGQGGNAGYVTSSPNAVTRFGLAFDHGSKGFLAHNYLTGASFFNLSSGQIISLVYGDGRTEDFQVQAIHRYQALSPNSTQSSFVNLDTGDNLSASELFYDTYNSDNPVVLQTCIARDGVSTWGRLFVIAVPVS